ncbi:hypothetical protein O1611_g1463 [Lasiodiplodia mahajangana]|uniref:Uncharacterized protein n=1 Tax=Lasiodiplodia mahajangana TaxID=1108764 RepID=A0ACC2JXH9_9PEZI|nr:hypothetical protein O1611_g1463 [Lasiodiplodia mahajangana]
MGSHRQKARQKFERFLNRWDWTREQADEAAATEPSHNTSQTSDRADSPGFGRATEIGRKSLWDQAYDALREEKPETLKAYEELMFKTLPRLAKASSTTELENSLSKARLGPTRPTTTTETSRRKMMEEIIELGQKHMDENGISFDIGQQRFVLRHQMQYVVAGVQAGKDWVNEAVKASPLASAAWAGVCLFLPLLTNPSEVQAANEEGLAYVAQKIQYYTAMESYFLCRRDDEAFPSGLKRQYEDRLVNLYSAIIDFQAQSVLRFFRGRFKNLVRDTVKWDSWEDMLKRVKELGDNLEKESLQTNTALMREALGRIASWAQESDEDRCLQSFIQGDYAWYKDRVEDRVPDTCLWFLTHDSYQSWLKTSSGPLLVSADPGCGKSVLAKYLIGSSFGFKAPKDAAICYFFFKEGDQNTISLAFGALIHQLLCLRPQLMHHALLRYKQFGANLSSNVSALWDIIQGAVADPGAGAIIIVLDALDECLQDERNMVTLSRYIRELCAQGPKNLKILMTSRPYQSTVRNIQELEESFPNIRIKGEDESETIREEINSVIEYRVSRMKKFNGDLKAHLKQRLLGITHRTYLWLYLVFAYLENPTIKNTTQGLDRAIQDLPITVSDAYEKILNRSPQLEETRKAIFILLAAYRPLTLGEMQVALDITTDTTSLGNLDLEPDERFKIRLRELCGLFVTVHDKKVYFLHQTAREFLLPLSASPPSLTTSTAWGHQFSIRRAHTVLAESCTVYMDLVNSLTNVDMKADFLYYSAQTWADHFREASISDDAAIVLSALRISDPTSKSYSVWSKVHKRCRDTLLEGGHTSLAIAAALGHESVVKQLLNKSQINVNLADKNGRTPLHLAVFHGNEGVVKLLLRDSQINVNLADNEGQMPIHSALLYSDEAMVKLLLKDSQIDVNLANGKSQTPINLAVLHGDEDMVKLLLGANQINVNLADEYGQTPLYLAALKGHEAIVKLLLNASQINVNLADNHSQTPLYVATLNRHPAVVKLLLNTSQINVHLGDELGRTPLHLAASRGHDAVVRLLLDASQIDVNLEDYMGRTPLYLADMCGHKSIVQLLSWV